MPRPYYITYTPLATSTTALAASVTGAAFTLTTTSMSDNMAHKITVNNLTANDHSGGTLAIVGTDGDGNAQTETLTGPAGSVGVTSAKTYLTLASVTPNATWGADTASIGITAVSNGKTIPVDYTQSPFDLGLVGEVTGTINFTVQYTYDDCRLSTVGLNYFALSALTSKTANTDANMTTPIMGVRMLVNSVTTGGTVKLGIIQGYDS